MVQSLKDQPERAAVSGEKVKKEEAVLPARELGCSEDPKRKEQLVEKPACQKG